MDVKVILSNGSIWHNSRSYLIGDIITGLDERIARRMISAGQVAKLGTKDADVVEVLPEVMPTVSEPEVSVVVPYGFTSEARQVELVESPAADKDTGEVLDELPPSVADTTSVDDSVNSIIGDFMEKPKRGRTPKR